MIRSLLFVPAKDKTLSKIPTLKSDACIIDLEDSIELHEKNVALERLIIFLKNNTSTIKIFVRLNADLYETEISRLNEFENIGFMLPKFELVNQYSKEEKVWKCHDVIALIETPLGLVNAKEIASCSWVDALAFGAEDYTSKVNMENVSERLYYQKSCIVTYAKAYGKFAFDTPSFKINQEDKFHDEVDDAVSLGFDGKMLIHPKHVDYINAAFNNHDIDEMIRIVKEYENNGEAVVVINGRVYEKMHINHMKNIIKENGGTLL